MQTYSQIKKLEVRNAHENFWSCLVHLKTTIIIIRVKLSIKIPPVDYPICGTPCDLPTSEIQRSSYGFKGQIMGSKVRLVKKMPLYIQYYNDLTILASNSYRSCE